MKSKVVSLVVVAGCLFAILAACGATPEPQVVDMTAVVEVQKEVVVAEPTMAPQPAATPALADASSGAGHALAAPVIRDERMIIKDAELELLVADTDAVLDSVTLIAGEYGGYLVSSHTWVEGEYKYATVRMGVPSAEFENVLRRLRGLAIEVSNEVASGEDVTDQYVDLQSRLTNLEATRDRIREFLDKAENVEEALQVNEQLSQVEGQIEEIQGRMNYLRDRSAYSTITLQLVPEKPTPTPTLTPTPTPTPTPAAWRPGQTFQSASGVLTDVVKGLAEVGIWVTVLVGPFALPVALVAWVLVRRRRRPAGIEDSNEDVA
jgi:hypothetical protein